MNLAKLCYDYGLNMREYILSVNENDPKNNNNWEQFCSCHTLYHEYDFGTALVDNVCKMVLICQKKEKQIACVISVSKESIHCVMNEADPVISTQKTDNSDPLFEIQFMNF